jgi:carbonic anhydrase
MTQNIFTTNSKREPEKMEHSGGARVLAELLEGNKRYIEKRRIYPNQSDDRRTSLVDSQSPHTIVLGCSDSRVPPEHIFDQGLGDLFVVRVAGNVIDDIVLASIEYAAEHLHTPLLIVLGHTNCGAVVAALQEDELDGHLPSIAQAIEEAVESSRDAEGDTLDLVIRTHARITAKHLKDSQPILKELVERGELMVVATYYNLDSGVVEIL